MTRRVVVIATAHVVVAAAIIATGRPDGLGSLAAAAGFAAAFALVGLVPMHLEFGRHACTVTLVEAVVVAALFELNTTGTIVAITVGELLAVVAARQRPLKVAFNVSATFAAVTLAAHTFALVAPGTARSPVAWAWALAAAGVYGFSNHASTSAVLMLVERQAFDAVFLASATTAAVATTAAASIGLAAVTLHALSPWAPVLVMPLVALVVLETRRLAAHRAEHLRFERLYLASRDTGRLQNTDDVLATLAGEARRLLTGSVGICCGPDRHGAWRGVVVDDFGHWPASADVLAEARAVADGCPEGEVTGAKLAESLRQLAPTVASAVVAGSGADSVTSVVLVVLREIAGDDGQTSRADVLGAFAGHASLTLSNALLYAEVEDALRHQLDLNRQKDDFVAVVSHELRTPLTSLLGSIRTLRRLDGRLAPERRERMYEIADRQGVRLQRLIEDLLLVAAAEDQSACSVAEPVALPEMLAEITAPLDGGRRERVAIDVEPAVRTVVTDPGKLAQLLFNLIENATKYAGDSRIEVVGRMRRGAPTIAVVDHGPGIAGDDRERAFERFVQLDQSSTRERGGTGLGLYLCRRLAHLLGAGLDLTDTPGRGCTFTVSLPASAASGITGAVQPDRAIAARGDGHEDGHMDGRVLAG